MSIRTELLAVTPIDGRYASRVEPLQPIVSEYGLIKRRVDVVVGWTAVMASGIVPDIEPLSDRSVDALLDISRNFGIEDAIKVKRTENRINHDANAVVRGIKRKMQQIGLGDYAEHVHFGCTSEDVNNLAFGLMIRDARDGVVLPHINGLTGTLNDMAERYAGMPMLARTHGQAASPTTFGKEMRVFGNRLESHSHHLGSVSLLGKYGGATGNSSALDYAYPDVNWPNVAKAFVESFGFEFNGVTTQIEPHDWMVRFFNEMALGNNILSDLSKDIWMYVMLKEVAQKADPKEDGSSAMPNKVNPIDAENAEANFGAANASLQYLANKLPVSRLQRDLSDSSAQRVMGEAFGHTVVAYSSMKKSLGKSFPNGEKMAANLNEEWAVLAEPLQTIMRKHGMKGAYDKIKKATRGLAFTQESYVKLVKSIKGLPQDEKDRLLSLTPADYVGLAPQIARGEI